MGNPRIWITVLVALAPGFPGGMVSAANPSVPEKVREIYVPFDDLKLILEEQPGRVLLSREEYETLLQASRKVPDGHAPYAVTVVSADYVVTVGGDRAEFAGILILDVMESGLRAVELEVDSVGVRRAVLDGLAAPMARNRPDRLTLFVEGQGRHQLALEMTAPVETTAAQQTLTFRLPTPSATRMSMTVSGNVEIKSGAAVVSRVFDETSQVTRFEILPQPEPGRWSMDEGKQTSRFEPPPSAGAVSLVMTLNNRLLQAQRAVTARGVLIDEITASYERLHATFSMTVLHQAVDHFRFAVPDGFDVTDVKSPLLSHWAVIPEESRSILEVSLRESTTEKVVVGVSALKIPGDPATWALPRLAPLNVVGEAAVVGLLLEDRLTLQSLTTDKLIPIDTGVITSALPGMMFGDEPGAPRLRAVAAYYSPTGSEGFDARGIFQEVSGRFLVTTNLFLTLGDKELRAQGGFALKPATEPLFAVGVSVPDRWHVLSVTDADGAVMPFDTLDAAEGEGTTRIRVAFPGGIAPGAQRSLYCQAIHTPAGWLSKWESMKVTFPVFTVRGAERDVGAIAVQSSDEMVAYPEVVEGLTPLDDGDKADYGLSAALGSRQAPAFRYERQPVHAVFRVERVVPRLTAKTYSFLQLDPHLVTAHYEVVFDIDRAKTDTLFFSLPESTPPDLSITGIEGTTVKEYESALVGDRRRWTIHLAEPRRNAVRLAVELEQPLDCSQPIEIVLPMVRTEGVAYQSGVVAVEGSAELDVQPLTTLRKVDVGELAGATHRPRRGAAGSLGVFAYVGDDPVIGVRVARRLSYGLPTAIVQRAEMVTQVSANGAAQTAARLSLRASAAFLEIELPAASDLWSVELDRKPMQPQREGDRLLLSLPAADRLLDVRIVYQSAVERVGLRGDVVLTSPRFSVRAEGEMADRVDVPTADLQWNVHLPVGFRLADYAGTATTRQLVSPEPAAWSVARAIWLATGGIRPFYGSCLPSLSRAREMSRRSARGVFESVDSPIGGALRDAEGIGAFERKPRAEAESEELLAKKGAVQQAQREAKSREKTITPSDGSSGPALKAPPAAVPPSPAPLNVWALEGVRSLQIELERSGNVVAFTNLGVDPTLLLTLANERRVTALGWGLAFAAALIGLVLTTRSVRIKARYVATVAALTTATPILLGSTELTYVANPVFYAVSLLVPYYVTVRLVRWLAANAHRPIRFRAPTAAILGLVLITTAQGEPPSDKGTQADPIVVRIAEPLRPIQVPDDVVIVPYDPSAPRGPDGAPKSGNQVLIPYAKFHALWTLAHREAGPKVIASPAPYAFAGGAFTATLQDDDDLDLEGHLDIVVYVDDFVTVPLVLSDAVLSRADLDGRPAQLGSQVADREGKSSDPTGMPFSLLVKGRGSHRLDLSARMRVARQGGWRVAQGRIPSAPGTALTLHITLAGTEVRLDGVCDRRSHDTRAPGEAITTSLGPDGAVNLRWRPHVQEGLSESSLTAASDVLLDVREDGVRLVWKLALDSGRGERDSHRLIVPLNYLIQSISGPNVRGWSATESDEREVTVSLLRPSKGAEEMTAVLHQRSNLASAKATECEAPIVRVVGAALQNGRLTIRRSSLLDLATTSASGVTRIDTPKAAEKLVALFPDVVDSPLGMVVYQSYQFASLPFVIQFSAKRAMSDWSAELQTVLRVGERRRTLETRLTITPLRQPVYQVRVGIPADLKIEHVDAPGAFEWAVSEGRAKTVTVRLAAGQKASFPIILRGTLGEEGPLERMELPRFGAKNQYGEVAIQTDPAFDLAFEPIRNCREIPLENIHHWLAPPQRLLARVAMSYWGDEYEALLRVTPRQPDVSCTTITNVRVTESTIEETILLDFVVSQAGVRGISFVLPGSMRDAHISVPMLRERTVEPLTSESESPVRVRLALQDEIMGRVRVLIENDRAQGGEAFRAPLAMVETGRTDRRYVALESAGRDEVAVESQVGFEALTHSQSEWRTLTDLVGAALTQAYVATGDNPVLTLKTRERTIVETTGARIGLARTVFVADAGGTYRATQSYRMDNRTEPFLEVLLPEGAGLWSVQVAGEPVKPAGTTGIGTDRRVRIPLIKSAAGDLDYEVVLKYAGQLPAPGALRTVDFPLLRATNIAVELSQVNLYLPEDYRWFDFGGTMRRVINEADLAAGFVRYQTRLTERLGQTLESDTPFARARASASLKEVESQTEQIRRARSSFGPNAAFDLELKSNEIVVARAQAQQQQQQALQQTAQAVESMDNREKLDLFFEKQQVARARNQVQEVADNFAAAPMPPEDRKEARPTFDPGWLKDTKLSDAAASEGEVVARQIQTRLDRDDSVRLRQQAAAVQPQGPQFTQQAAKGEKAPAESDKKAATARGKRAAGTDDLAKQYRATLEPPSARAAATPAPVEGRAGSGGGGGQAVAMTGLAVDFPLRGVAFHFTTPRGEVSVTARSISRSFLEVLTRLGLTVLALVGFALVYLMATRLKTLELIGASGVTVMIVLGVLSTLTGLLPVVGISAVIGGLIARKRLRVAHTATSG